LKIGAIAGKGIILKIMAKNAINALLHLAQSVSTMETIDQDALPAKVE